jgi:hypothetical protein
MSARSEPVARSGFGMSPTSLSVSVFAQIKRFVSDESEIFNERVGPAPSSSLHDRFIHSFRVLEE